MIAAARAAIERPFAGMPPEQRRTLGLWALSAVLVLFPLLHDNDANIDAMANAGVLVALALGLNVVVGFAGLLDLGYAAFFALGAYYYGIFTAFQIMPPFTEFWVPFEFLGLVEKINRGGPDLVRFTLSFWLALPTAAIVTAVFGVMFGAPTLRLRGDYLAIVTLGFGEIVPIVARNIDGVTGGAAGLNGVMAPRLFGWSFGVAAWPYYYVVLGLVALLIFVSLRLRDSRVGRAWRALREDETAASAMGVNLVNYKLLAFATGAAFAGMAGVVFIAKLQTATPDMFNFNVSAMLLVMVVLGGMGSVWGVVLGAFLLQIMQSWFLPELSGVLRAIGEMVGWAWLARIELVEAIQLIFGIILVVMMLFRREGLIPAVKKQAALHITQQAAQVTRGGFTGIEKIGRWTPGTGNALEVKGVTVKFGGLVALNSVDLVVPAGGVVAVIGPNGSGKSTLFNVITGLVEADGGSIKFEGVELLGLRPDQVLTNGVARTFQNIRLFPNLTVLENVLIGEHARLTTGPIGAVAGMPKARAEEEGALKWATDIIALFGNRLTPRIGQIVSGLSYANRRRVEIARALASRPRILLLDEPTAGMNPAETLELAEQIKSLHEMGLTILLIEHKLDVVTRLASNVIVLDHGEKIAEGPANEVRRNEEVLRAYLGRAATEAAAKEKAPKENTNG
ncbi:MAG: branched-chain amino acid ABC transporter ATP-binding protein/permease [Alphaproteobacteria bacterium]|nr:branched-chain amino acid ABC transporter ATP-binding protein/permease [Alphaproteobacteria bacterium]